MEIITEADEQDYDDDEVERAYSRMPSGSVNDHEDDFS